MQATVNNIFLDVDITQDAVDKSIEEAIKNPENTFLNDVTYEGKYCSYTIQVFYFGEPDMNEPLATLF